MDRELNKIIDHIYDPVWAACTKVEHAHAHYQITVMPFPGMKPVLPIEIPVETKTIQAKFLVQLAEQCICADAAMAYAKGVSHALQIMLTAIPMRAYIRHVPKVESQTDFETKATFYKFYIRASFFDEADFPKP